MRPPCTSSSLCILKFTAGFCRSSYGGFPLQGRVPGLHPAVTPLLHDAFPRHGRPQLGDLVQHPSLCVDVRQEGAKPRPLRLQRQQMLNRGLGVCNFSVNSASAEQGAPGARARVCGHRRHEFLRLLDAPCSGEKVHHGCADLRARRHAMALLHLLEEPEALLDEPAVATRRDECYKGDGVRVHPLLRHHPLEEANGLGGAAVHPVPVDQGRPGDPVLLWHELELAPGGAYLPALAVHIQQAVPHQQLPVEAVPHRVAVGLLPERQQAGGGAEGEDDGQRDGVGRGGAARQPAHGPDHPPGIVGTAVCYVCGDHGVPQRGHTTAQEVAVFLEHGASAVQRPALAVHED